MNEFVNAAFPWIVLGLFAAVSCAFMAVKKK